MLETNLLLKLLRVLSLMESLPDLDPEAGEKVYTVNGDIDFCNVHFFYQMRPENVVLKDVSLSIKSGQTCAIVGRSGSGKTTLINLLMRFYGLRGGTIFVDGKDISTLNIRSLHSFMGLVAQVSKYTCSTNFSRTLSCFRVLLKKTLRMVWKHTLRSKLLRLHNWQMHMSL